MSYILEALKKAQAERQLGHSPTIHAPTLQAGDQASAGGRLKKPLLLIVAAMGIVIAVLVALVLRPAGPAATLPTPQTAAVTPAQPSLPAPQTAAAPTAPPVQAALPAPVAALPPPVATVSPAMRPAPEPAVPAPAQATNTPTPARPTAASEEPVLNLRELPEPIQRSIPKVAVGGYIYSKNAADRVLLIDKVLRREGEEVAPGLILEKLNPKEAVFNFKGYRYRVPY